MPSGNFYVKMKLNNYRNYSVTIMATIKVPCGMTEKACSWCEYRQWGRCNNWTDVQAGSLPARKWEGALERATIYWKAVDAEMDRLSQELGTHRIIQRDRAIENVNAKTNMSP
jgi:hypothetical protein